jgi:cyclohexanecarboxylate-CoA ligase
MDASSAADRAFAPESWWREETLRDWVERTAAAAPQQPAVLATEGPLSFADLHRRALALSHALRRLGVGRGDVVAAQLPNSVEFILTYLAAGYAGAILQTIHMPYRAAEIEPLLHHGGAKAVVCLARTKDFAPAETAVALRGSLPGLRHVVAVGDGAPAGALAFPQAGEAAESGTCDTYRPSASDPFLLLYTSGTAAAPKGVPIAYKKFLANARLSAAELGLDRSSIVLSAAPFTHLYGLFSLNLAFAAGATTALLPVFAPAGFAAALDAHRPTAAFVAPAHVAACLNEGLLTRERLASLRFIMISGTVCPPPLARRLQDMMPDGKVCQLWGMSEMQAGTFTRPNDDLETRLSSAGRASPGTQLRVMDGGTPAEAGREGELEVRGCSVFEGYFANEEATAAAFTADGWFRTGDLARMDARGNILITGRLKDVINRGGVKFNPADVEAVIARHPAVMQCAIAPIPDATLGERACCFVVMQPAAARLDLEALRAWLMENNIAKMKWPERLEIIDEMPMTPTRKIKKAELVKRILG